MCPPLAITGAARAGYRGSRWEESGCRVSLGGRPTARIPKGRLCFHRTEFVSLRPMGVATRWAGTGGLRQASMLRSIRAHEADGRSRIGAITTHSALI